MADSLLTHLAEFSQRLAGAPMPKPTELKFDPVAGRKEIVSDQSYFGLTLNQLNLAKGREWYSQYEPLVYVAIDFLYDTNRITIPKLIGPSALKASLPVESKLPHGFLVENIRVTGPHVYRGEQVGITFVLFKVRSTDYSKRLLQVAESLSEAIGIAGVGALTKMGGSVMKGIETLFGAGDTQPVLGKRIELKASPLDGFREQTNAMLASSESVAQELSLADNRLCIQSGEQYASSDFVLYTIWEQQTRDTEAELPFYSEVKKMYLAASAGDEQGWQRAKATLVAIYQEMLTSPDLTAGDAERLFQKYKLELIARRKVAQEVAIMGKTGAQRSREELERKLLNTRAEEIIAL
jgi:hypothetical protein